MNDYDKYHDHEHQWDPAMQICTICYLTKEELFYGRDESPTWGEVDQAYKDGYNLGKEIGAAEYKYTRRRKLIEVGYYLCLRQLSKPKSEGGL